MWSPNKSERGEGEVARGIAALLLGLSLSVAGGASAQLGNVAAGKLLFEQTPSASQPGCAGGSCHPGYMQYKRGASLEKLEHVNANPGIMEQGFAGLSDQDLRNLAAHISSLSSQDAVSFKITGRVIQQNFSGLIPNIALSINNAYLPSESDPNLPAIENEQAISSSQSGFEGIFEFNGLPAGDYRISISDPQYSFSPTYRDITVTEPGGGTLVEVVTGVDFAGTALDGGRALYENAACDGCHGSHSELGQNQHDILRGARLSLLVELKADGHKANFSTFPAQWSQLSGSELGTLAAYLSNQDEQPYTLEGNLKDAANLPNNVTDHNIEVQLTSSYLPAVEPTKPTAGTFSFTDLKAGDYDVVASHPAYDFAPTKREVALNRQGVWLDRSAASPTMGGTLLEDADLTGTVKADFAAGKTLYEAKCLTCHTEEPHGDDPRIVQGNEPTTNVSCKPCGEAVPWPHVLMATDGGNLLEPAPQEMLDVTTTLSDNDIHQLAKYLSIMFPVPLEVEARVEFVTSANPVPRLGPDTAGIPGATATLESTRLAETRTVTTDENGRARMSGLAGGGKLLSISKPGFSFSATQFEWKTSLNGGSSSIRQASSATSPSLLLVWPQSLDAFGFFSTARR